MAGVLGLTKDDALAAWAKQVRGNREQAERVREAPPSNDFYAHVAHAFTADPRRTDEPALDALRELVQPGETWLDIGAGGGRYALPLALLAKEVVALDPSDGMLAALAQSAKEHGISNARAVHARWPNADQPISADVSLISHVGYDIEDIGPFVDQLEAHTRRMCAVMLYDRSPVSYFAPLWQAVHGEPRVLLPGLGDFVALLFARGRAPSLTTITLPQRGFQDVAALHGASRRPLWVLPDTPEDERLATAVAQLAVPVEGGVGLSARPRVLGLVTWQPSRP